MPLEPLTIDGFTKGQVKRLPPFRLQGDEFVDLENLYSWRQRIKRREPSSQVGRLRRELEGESLGNSGASPWSFNIFTLLGLAATEPDAEIEIGSVEITIAGPIVFTDQSDGTLDSGTGGNSGIINYYTGDVTLTHTAGTGAATTIDMNYYPTLPVMGIGVREESDLNLEKTLFFDTKYAYEYNTGSDDFNELPSTAPTTWGGSDSDFFWIWDYARDTGGSNSQLTWVTNFAGPSVDPIRYYNGTTWASFTPAVTSTISIYQARIIIPFKGSLLLLNTQEGTTAGGAAQFPQRLRYSAFENPLNTNAWREDIIGKGGFIDAPTNEHIVSAYFVRDVLVVGFERSTWSIRFTGNPTLPFVWERINSELGVESTFAYIGFDKGVLNFGSRGITLTDGNDTNRIDEDIPDQIFQIANERGGPKRVIGIRDFHRELALWTYVDSEAISPYNQSNYRYPNRMLIHNYIDKSWQEFTDHYTFLGTLQREKALTWDDLTKPWNTYHFRWEDARLQFGYPQIVGGNQQGYIMQLNGESEEASLSIQGIASGTDPTFTVPQHNLPANDIIEINGVDSSVSSVETELNGNRFRVDPIDADTFKVQEWTGTLWVPIVLASHTYIGGGEVTRVYNFDILSKQFNLVDIGSRLVFNALEAQLKTTEDGEFTVDLYTDYNQQQAIQAGATNFWNRVMATSGATLTGSNPLYAIRALYANTIAQFFQTRMYLTDAQMVDAAIQGSDVEILSLTLWVKRSGPLQP